VLAYSPRSGRIYAGVSGCGPPSAPSHVSVFPDSANGDVAPARTIEGAATGLHQYQEIEGIAVSPADGGIFVMSTRCVPSGIGPGRVSVFARLAMGNVRLERSFTDATTHFTDVQGIAFPPR
jgi:hypothetical protein